MAVSAAVKAAMKRAGQGAKNSGGGNNIRHGRGILMIDKWYWRQGHKGLSHVHEFIVTKSEKNIVMEGDKKIDVEPNAVNSSCSAVYNYDGKAKDMAGVNSARFVLGLFGLEADAVSEEDVEKTIEEGSADDSNPCRGMVIGYETYPIQTKAGAWIVGVKWSCVNKPGEGQNTIEAAKARWDAFQLSKSAMETAAKSSEKQTATQ